MTLATCFASQTANIMSTVFFTRENLIKPVFDNNNHQSDTMASPTTSTMMRSPTENPEKGRKGKRVSAFFKRVWKAAKRPFLSCDRSRVVPFEPQSDVNDFEHLPVPGPSRTVTAHADPEPVWLPGQVCEEPQPLSVPGPYRIKQTAEVPNADRARPESSTALTGHVDTEQMHPPVQDCDSLESLAVPGTSRIKSTTIADHVDPEQMRPPVQVCEEPQPLSVPGPSRIKQSADSAQPESSTALTGHVDTELVCLPGTISVHGPSNTKKMTDADSDCPELPLSVQDPSKIDGTEEKPRKGRKWKRVSAFFKRVWKAAKRPFLCCDTDEVQHFTPQPEPEPEPEPELESDPDLDSVCLPGLGEFEMSQYEVEYQIGEGFFGEVYVASHKRSNRVKVALKVLVMSQEDRYLDVDGHSTPVLAEVAMMLRLMNAPRCPNIIRLHDWIEIGNNFVLILEYAESCQTLHEYIKDTGEVEENQARRLIRQLIRAVMFCTERGVFHGDIHTANILVTLPRLELKLIDFGCAQPITQEPFNKSDYRGAGQSMPPEALMCRVFHANPAYVWTIGIMLYEIMHGRLAFNNTHSIVFGSIHINTRLSTACVDLISQCLIRNPAKRLQLHQVEEHCWFNPTTPNPVKQLYKRREN
ncbi:uncharacterized protein [Danio rerio]|uniref:non-specific serine/threonine protein kinase n=2 Tax=Danio rerio TaxID=7955 RepID=A0AB32TKD7_DANRE